MNIKKETKTMNKNDFYKYWFEGFERAIHNLDEEARKTIFKECGKSCSESYTKEIYIQEFQSSKNLVEFLCRLKNRFPEVGFIIINENEMVELTYHFCACDLVKEGLVKTPLLCECSRQSLLYNWGSVYGRDNIDVQLMQSILEGNPCCKFLIHIKID